MRTHTKETQEALTPELALEILKEGNDRFVKNLKTNRNLLQQVNETSESQHPFAVILSCIDSRVPAELIFDQGLGDIFSIRIAGNFINEDILGSMEFACKIAGAKLVVILGHSNCGAIKGACDNAQLGNLTKLLSHIRPAVADIAESGDRTSNNMDFVQKVAENNVEIAINQVKERSPVLAGMITSREIGLVGGMYSVKTGKVTFKNIKIFNQPVLPMMD